jgi:hypothetical protein
MKIYIILIFIHICKVYAKSENPPWIYEIGGVEYVDSSLRNDTLKIVLQQSVRYFFS